MYLILRELVLRGHDVYSKYKALFMEQFTKIITLLMILLLIVELELSTKLKCQFHFDCSIQNALN